VEACDNAQISGYSSATTLTDIYYLARRQLDRPHALNAVKICVETFTICAVNLDTVLYALHLPGLDFEDNIQVACAVRYRCTHIVTRDVKEFSSSPIRVLTPTALLQELP